MQITLNNVRLSFPDLFQAKLSKLAAPGSKPSYSATLLVPKDSALRKEIDKHIEAAVAAEIPDKAKAAAFIKKWGNDTRSSCWTDGDDKEYDGYADHWALKANRKEDKGRPTVVDRQGNPVSETDGLIYAGCYVNAKVDLYIQNGEYTGIRASLLGVQFVKDGEPFSAGSGVAKFDALEDEEEASLV